MNVSVNVPESAFVTVICCTSFAGDGGPEPCVVVVTAIVGTVRPSAPAMMLFSCWIAPAGFCRTSLTLFAKSEATSSSSDTLLFTSGSGCVRIPASALPPLEPSRLRTSPTISCSAAMIVCRSSPLNRSRTALKSGPWNWNVGVGSDVSQSWLVACTVSCAFSTSARPLRAPSGAMRSFTPMPPEIVPERNPVPGCCVLPPACPAL